MLNVYTYKTPTDSWLQLKENIMMKNEKWQNKKERWKKITKIQEFGKRYINKNIIVDDELLTA